MSRTRARFTQADIARCIRAAQQCGAKEVAIRPDGTIEISLDSRKPAGERTLTNLAEPWPDASDGVGTGIPAPRVGEIPPEFLNGKYVYSQAEFEAVVRSRPLGKLELSVLGRYFEADDQLRYIGGIATNEKLEARGFIEVVGERPKERMPNYRITQAGKAEWLRLSGPAVT